MNEIVDAQMYVDVLKEQRNDAYDRAAVAIARSTAYRMENATLKERVSELEAELKKLKEKE